MRFMRWIRAGLLLAAVLAAPLAAQEQAKTATTHARKSGLDKPTLEAYVRHLFLWGPQIKVSVSDPKPSQLPGMVEVRVLGTAGAASQEELFYVTNDGQKIVRAAVYDIQQNPFREDLDKLKTEFQPSLGTPGAPVVLVLFSDFQCSFCKEEARMLRQNLIAAYPTQVRLYFKDFPLEQIHPWAKPAAIAGRCVFRQNPTAFWPFHDWLFENQTSMTAENLRAKVLEYGKNHDLDVAQLTRCVDNRSTENEVNRSMAEARALQVNSTPTLFVNGRRITSHISWPALKQIIDFELEYQKTAKNAGETACCSQKLPTPLK